VISCSRLAAPRRSQNHTNSQQHDDTAPWLQRYRRLWGSAWLSLAGEARPVEAMEGGDSATPNASQTQGPHFKRPAEFTPPNA